VISFSVEFPQIVAHATVPLFPYTLRFVPPGNADKLIQFYRKRARRPTLFCANRLALLFWAVLQQPFSILEI